MFINNIDNDNNYKHDKCIMNNCNYIGRSFRDFDKMNNSQSRHKLYHSQNKEINIIISQILDSLHVMVYHSFDMGYKIKRDESDNIKYQVQHSTNDQEKEEKKGDDDDDDDDGLTFSSELKEIKKKIITQKNKFKKVRPDYNNKNGDNHNHHHQQLHHLKLHQTIQPIYQQQQHKTAI